jgi:hypothetical protein
VSKGPIVSREAMFAMCSAPLPTPVVTSMWHVGQAIAVLPFVET